jgi:hypothetical protein
MKMPKNETFFSLDTCGDRDYEAVRDLPQAKDCKCFVEELWRDYKPYCDTNFLSDARNHFHQRFWEMYLCVTMLKRGFVIEKSGSEGPEFSITIEGKKFWFEAIAPETGTTDDRVPDFDFEQTSSVPTEKVLMRYTAALSEKLRKYQGYRAKGIISENDGYIVAINSNKIPYAYFGSILPYHVQAFLPFGDFTVAVNPKTHEKVDEYFQYRGEVKNKNNSPISTQPFLDPTYRGISAIIHSKFDVAGYACGTARWGENFDVLHNPLATSPLPFEALNWCKYRYMRDDKLETVERTPHEHVDNPIKNWENLRKNPDFEKDPRSWKQREAFKVLDELRHSKEN